MRHVGRTATLWVRHYWSIKTQLLLPLQHFDFGINASGRTASSGGLAQRKERRPLERLLILLTMARPSKMCNPHSRIDELVRGARWGLGISLSVEAGQKNVHKVFVAVKGEPWKFNIPVFQRGPC